MTEREKKPTRERGGIEVSLKRKGIAERLDDSIWGKELLFGQYASA